MELLVIFEFECMPGSNSGSAPFFAAIRWVRLHFMHLLHLQRLELLRIRQGPVFFNSTGELPALLSRHVT